MWEVGLRRGPVASEAHEVVVLPRYRLHVGDDGLRGRMVGPVGIGLQDALHSRKVASFGQEFEADCSLALPLGPASKQLNSIMRRNDFKAHISDPMSVYYICILFTKTYNEF